jgi:pyruvate/2-oxoglutarate/acetoin dehydrogenase E1 component
MGKYFDELKRSMDYLGQKDNTLFLGQAVEYAGTAMTNTLKDVEKNKLIEMPVNEDMQMGITNGLALNGFVPISIYPRWNFLLLATNQIVNHLDKIKNYSKGEYNPKVIIRTGIGSVRPMNPQHQHVGDYSQAFQMMLPNMEVIRLEEPEQIFEAYYKAYNRDDGKSTIIVEYGDYYNEK